MKKIIILIIILLYMGNTNANTYYVDASVANSGNGSINSPWKTIDNVNFAQDHQPIVAGDSILFKRGCTWTLSTTPLLPIASGSEGYPIIYGAYGTSADKPIIDGNSTVLCVDIDTKSYINFIGLKFIHGYRGNSTYPSSDVNLWYCSHITFDSCNIDNSIGGDIHKVNLYDGQGSYLIVRNCTLNYGEQATGNGNLGIYLDGTDNSLMEYDTLIGNYSNIRIAFGDDHGMANNDTIRYCVLKNGLYDNVDDDGSNNAIFYYNIFESSSLPSYHENLYIFAGSKDGGGNYTEYTPQASKYYNNTFITHNPIGLNHEGNAYGGKVISIDTWGGNANNFEFKNNIFNYDGDTGPFAQGYIFYNSNASTGWVFNNNIYNMENGAYDHA
jgi:hypothetical protein